MSPVNIHDVKWEKSCGAVIYHSGLYLVLQHKPGHWSFCKGHIEAGEEETDTARREILEETSLWVRLKEDFREEISYSPKKGTMKIVVFFLALPQNNEVTIDQDEIIDYKWLPAAQAIHQLSFESEKEIIKKAETYLSSKK